MSDQESRQTGTARRARATAAVLLALLVIAGPAQVRAGGEPLAVSEIAPGVFFHAGVQEDASVANQGRIANLGFVVGSERVAVIDTGGSLDEGLALRAAVRRVTDLPIAYVILTHVHPDHILGAAAFAPEHPAFVGHARLPDAMARRGAGYLSRAKEELGPLAAGSRLVPPGLTVPARLDLDLGGRVLELRAWPTAHTDADLTLFDRATGTLWLSDLLFVERIPALDGSLLGWLSVCDELLAFPARRVVPGHGPVPTDWHAALTAQRRYLADLADGVRRVIRARGTLEQAVTEVGREESGRWILFDDYQGRNVTAAFVELEWE